MQLEQLPFYKHEPTLALSLQAMSDGEITSISGHLSVKTQNNGDLLSSMGARPLLTHVSACQAQFSIVQLKGNVHGEKGLLL